MIFARNYATSGAPGKEVTERTALGHGRHGIISQRRLIPEAFLDLLQKEVLLAPADLYFHPVAHDYGTSFAAFVFFNMKKIDQKRFVDAHETGIGK